MKIPSYSPLRGFRPWLAWRLRLWSQALDPERPYVVGPFPCDRMGRVGWSAFRGRESVAWFNVPSADRRPAKERP